MEKNEKRFLKKYSTEKTERLHETGRPPEHVAAGSLRTYLS